MSTEVMVALCIFVGFAVAEAIWTRLLHKPKQTRTDGIVELISTVILVAITQPSILIASGLLMSWAFPDARGSLAGLPIIAQVGLLLIFDDMMQYWWHRASHSTPWLYNLHRPHHDAQYMSVRIVYRNNLFYYAMMPSLWFSGVLIYLGLGWVYAFYLVTKMAVICGAHSDIRWDAPLYKIQWLSPVMWVVERIISTPATHSAHHGQHKADGITNYKGNFGNLLFFWDVLFGTAKITRRYPENIGVENLPPMSAEEQLLWPLVRASSASQAQSA